MGPQILADRQILADMRTQTAELSVALSEGKHADTAPGCTLFCKGCSQPRDMMQGRDRLVLVRGRLSGPMFISIFDSTKDLSLGTCEAC